MSIITPKLFHTIKWPEGKHPSEKAHFLGRFSEWFFDYGQKSYSVDPTNLKSRNVTLLENSKLKKSSIKKIVDFVSKILKVMMSATIIIPLIMLAAKLIYRKQNSWEIDPTKTYTFEEKSIVSKNEMEELREAEILGGIFSQVELEKYYLLLDSKIDEFKVKNINDLSGLIDFYRDLSLHHALIKSFITPELQKKYSEATYLPEVLKKCEDLILKFSAKIKEQFKEEHSDIREFFVQFELFLMQNFEDPEFFTKFNSHIPVYLQAVKFFSTLGEKDFYNKDFAENLERSFMPKGIPNLGNSCYMNSALQSILSVPFFKEILSKNKNCKRFILNYEKQNSLKSSTARKLRDSIFKNNLLEGRQTEQNDPARLLSSLLAEVDYSLELVSYNIENKENRVIQKEPLLTISLKENREKGLHSHSFQDLINREFSEQKISDDQRILKLSEAPEYMVVQLLRFGNDLDKHRDELIFNLGENIDFSEAIFNKNPGESYLYEPAAVIYHHGNNINFGHYTADVKRGGTWYQCNDAHITEKGLVNTDIGNGYVYVFKRKNSVGI